jgi:hypothetical protein
MQVQKSSVLVDILAWLIILNIKLGYIVWKFLSSLIFPNISFTCHYCWMAAKVKKVFPSILFTCHYAFNSHFLCIKATPSQSSAQVILQQVKKL